MARICKEAFHTGSVECVANQLTHVPTSLFKRGITTKLSEWVFDGIPRLPARKSMCVCVRVCMCRCAWVPCPLTLPPASTPDSVAGTASGRGICINSSTQCCALSKKPSVAGRRAGEEGHCSRQKTKEKEERKGKGQEKTGFSFGGVSGVRVHTK